MTAKQYLFQVRTLRGNIQRCTEQITVLEHQMSGIGAIRYDTVRVQATPEDRRAELIDKLIETQNKLVEMRVEYARALMVIQQEIYRLPVELHRLVLSEYFLDGRTMQKIAERHHYNREYLYRKYEEALAEFEAQNAGKNYL